MPDTRFLVHTQLICPEHGESKFDCARHIITKPVLLMRRWLTRAITEAQGVGTEEVAWGLRLITVPQGCWQCPRWVGGMGDHTITSQPRCA